MLVLSGAIGEGHDAVARALQEVLVEVWPGCIVRTADTFASMGKAAGPLFRWLYVTAIRFTPVLEEVWYQGVRRSPMVHWVYRQWIGGWAGRAVAAELARTRPDVVVSTYPLATAGLGWLSGQGRVGIPSAAVLSDFAPHPFWVYPGIDRYFVLSDTARDSIGGSPPAPRSWSVPRRLRPASLLPAATRS